MRIEIPDLPIMLGTFNVRVVGDSPSRENLLREDDNNNNKYLSINTKHVIYSLYSTLYKYSRNRL